MDHYFRAKFERNVGCFVPKNILLFVNFFKMERQSNSNVVTWWNTISPDHRSSADVKMINFFFFVKNGGRNKLARLTMAQFVENSWTSGRLK